MRPGLWLAPVLLALAVPAAAGTGTIKGTVSRAGSPPTPLADAVVMVEGPAEPAASGAPHVVMTQRDQQFVPRVVAVPVGTTVDFPNDDPVLHNVNSPSAAKKFDLGMYGQGETKSVTFDAPGVVAIRCNVHPRMEGFVVVHGNAYAAVTDAHGVYTIRNVPAGSYQVRAWHEAAAERTVPVTVHDGEVVPLDLRFERGR